MSEANAVRGEVSLELEGVEYVLRPSYEAIVQVEEETGKSILELATSLSTDDQGNDVLRGFSLRDASTIACRFIQAHGRATGAKHSSGATPQRIGELIMESDGGLMVASLALTTVLMKAATGGYSASGEIKAVTNPTSGETLVAA